MSGALRLRKMLPLLSRVLSTKSTIECYPPFSVLLSPGRPEPRSLPLCAHGGSLDRPGIPILSCHYQSHREQAVSPTTVPTMPGK